MGLEAAKALTLQSQNPTYPADFLERSSGRKEEKIEGQNRPSYHPSIVWIQRPCAQEDMIRGYFDDFKELRETEGKIFRATERLIPVSHAPRFPIISPTTADGTSRTFPARDGPPVTLLCAAFRAGAQPMIESWAIPFSVVHAESAGAASLCELSLVEQPLMKLWPFRNAIVRSGRQAGKDKYMMHVEHLFYFGNTDELRRNLEMRNRWTGYVFLLDSAGRVRWRGCGPSEESERASMILCSRQLIDLYRKESSSLVDSG